MAYHYEGTMPTVLWIVGRKRTRHGELPLKVHLTKIEKTSLGHSWGFYGVPEKSTRSYYYSWSEAFATEHEACDAAIRIAYAELHQAKQQFLALKHNLQAVAQECGSRID
jgi:hypothetical protein